MGDVVVGLVLKDRGLLEDIAVPAPEVFILGSSDASDQATIRVMSMLRRAGIHARRRYRSTRTVGKLLGDASKVGARFAVILGARAEEGMVDLKDLGGGVQETVPINEMISKIIELRAQNEAGNP